MNDFLIATHSTLAQGLLNSATLLIGKQSHLQVINAYVDESDWTQQLDEYFSHYTDDTQHVVFTDIFGGSVNQKVVQYKERYDFVLVTGINLPVLLEALLATEPLTAEKMQDIIDRGRDALQVVELEHADENDDDFLD